MVRESIPGGTNPGSYGIYGHPIDTEGSGQIHITVNGILIRSIPVKGAYIYSEVVLDFPADTELTQDRGSLDYWSEKNTKFMQQVIQRAVEKDDVRWVNTLEPLLGKEGFNLYEIKLPFSTQTLPFRSEISDLRKVENKRLQFLSEQIFNRSVDTIPIIKKPKGEVAAVFVSQFDSTDKHSVRFFSLQDRYPVFFLDERFQLQHLPFGKRVLNALYKERISVRSGYSDAIPFSVPSDIPIEKKTALAATSSSESIASDVAFSLDGVEEAAVDFSELKIAVGKYHCVVIPKMFCEWIQQIDEKNIGNHNFLRALKRTSLSAPIVTKAVVLLYIGAIHFYKETAGKFPTPESFFSGIESEKWGRIVADVEKYGNRVKPIMREIRFSKSFEKKISHHFFANQVELVFFDKLNLFDDDEILEIISMESDDIFKLIKNPKFTFDKFLPFLKEGGFPSSYYSVLNLLQLFDERVITDVHGKYTDEIQERTKYSGNIRILPPYLTRKEKPLSLAEREKNLDSISALYNLSYIFCARGGEIFLKMSSESKSEMFHNCEIFLPILWEQLILRKDEALKNELITLVNKRFYLEGSFPNLNVVFWWLKQQGIITDTNMPIIYPLLFGSAVSAQKKVKFPQDELPMPNFHPIAENQTVQRIMGGTASDINKQYLLAMRQNPNPFSWMKELSKNAQEAGGTTYDLSLFAEGSADDRHIVMIFSDNGSGVSEEDMHVFFVPGISTKARQSDDINFGWGFFTLFSYFDEVTVISSQDGAKTQLVYLRKAPNGSLEIAQTSIEGSKLISEHGTKIMAKRKKKLENEIEFSILKANYLQSSQGVEGVAVKWNQIPIESISFGVQNELILQKYPLLDKGGKFELFTSPQRGVFYRGRLQTVSLDAYLEGLPPYMKKLEQRMTRPFGFHLKGEFSQNANRTAFLEEKAFVPHFAAAVKEHILEAFAYELTVNPNFISMAYDYFYEFRFPHIIPAGPARDLSDPPAESDLVPIILSLPIYPAGPSHAQLHNEIGTYLRENHITNEYNDFSPDSVFASTSFIEEFQKRYPSPFLFPLLQKFSDAISQRISGIKFQQVLGSAGKGKLIEYPDFDIQHIPAQFQGRGKNLAKISKFTTAIMQDLLGENLKVHYCFLSNGAEAHARKGIPEIALNLNGNTTIERLEKMEASTFSLDLLTQLLTTVTHEMVHTHEVRGETTHDERFFDRQQVYLEKLLQVKEPQIEHWKELWIQVGK